ncbi:MAG: GMC family oxidoreductase [Jatrophihabitantaceae bacterium]
MSDFDYIVVGAGGAGCVVANRLSEDPSVRVLLIEYGGRGRNPVLRVPKGFFFTMRGERYCYQYPTRPVGHGGQIETWTRGKVLGGSTAINGMMYVRGAAADYDAMVARGNPGWGWADMLPVFRAMEDHALGASAQRGVGGPLGISVTEHDDTLSAAILDAAQQQGWRYTPDYNLDDDERIGFTPATIRRGVRVSSAGAFLRPAARRPNLTIRTGTRVGYLLLSGARVVGVRAGSGSTYRDYTVAREVIVSAGTIESTLLLERSGIGRAEVLAAAGVEPVVDSPNLGERVVEQRGVGVQVALNQRIGPTERLNTIPKQGVEGMRYLLTRRGPIATAGYDLVCAFRSSPEVDRPDVQGIWVPMAIDTSTAHMRLADHSGVMFVGYQVRPGTRSSVHISGTLPENAPVIDAHFLETGEDRAVTSTILGTVREVFARSPLADLVRDEEVPGAAVSTPDEVVRYALDTGAGLYHAVGSAAMGPGADDVVDAQLRVRGVDGLRIVDASVFAEQPAGNTAAPTMALAWRAADLIRDPSGERRGPSG